MWWNYAVCRLSPPHGGAKPEPIATLLPGVVVSLEFSEKGERKYKSEEPKSEPRLPAASGGIRKINAFFENAFFIIFRNVCKFLAGSFSAVSKRNFARKYAFDSIFQALQDLHHFAPLQSQNFRKNSVWKNSNFCENSAKFLQMSQNLQNLKILPNRKNFS